MHARRVARTHRVRASGRRSGKHRGREQQPRPGPRPRPPAALPALALERVMKLADGATRRNARLASRELRDAADAGVETLAHHGGARAAAAAARRFRALEDLRLGTPLSPRALEGLLDALEGGGAAARIRRLSLVLQCGPRRDLARAADAAVAALLDAAPRLPGLQLLRLRLQGQGAASFASAPWWLHDDGDGESDEEGGGGEREREREREVPGLLDPFALWSALAPAYPRLREVVRSYGHASFGASFRAGDAPGHAQVEVSAPYPEALPFAAGGRALAAARAAGFPETAVRLLTGHLCCFNGARVLSPSERALYARTTEVRSFALGFRLEDELAAIRDSMPMLRAVEVEMVMMSAAPGANAAWARLPASVRTLTVGSVKGADFGRRDPAALRALLPKGVALVVGERGGGA